MKVRVRILKPAIVWQAFEVEIDGEYTQDAIEIISGHLDGKYSTPPGWRTKPLPEDTTVPELLTEKEFYALQGSEALVSDSDLAIYKEDLTVRRTIIDEQSIQKVLVYESSPLKQE